MRYVSRIALFTTVMLLLAACDKVDNLPHYGTGNAVVLSTSQTTVAATAADSLNGVVTFSWTHPGYAIDSTRVKYILEIDSAGRNFAHAVSRTVTNNLSLTFTGKEFNSILLGFGFSFNVPYNIEARVLSSYTNNNEQLASNTIAVTATPYKIPPAIALPASGRLFIVGDASDFGWSNDAAPPFPATREFTRLTETQWAGIFNMTGTGGFKILEIQGNWDVQYHMVAGGNPLSGNFKFENADPAFPSPEAGTYKVAVDFQTGKYSLVKWDNPVVKELYVTGDAVTPNWVNNPPADLKFTEITNSVFEITLSLVPGKQYKFLSIFGSWQPQFGGTTATGGTLGANYGTGSDPAGVPTPDEAGNYKINVNFITNSYTVTKL